MLAKVTSCAVVGLDGELVEVEVDISGGLPAFKAAFLPMGVGDSKDRLRRPLGDDEPHQGVGHQQDEQGLGKRLAPYPASAKG